MASSTAQIISEPWEEELPTQNEPTVDEELQLRALNSDNHREVEQLIDLYHRTYGTSYPFKQVYEENFWMAKGEDIDESDGLVNIVATSERRFVAHVALRSTFDNRRGEMLFFAIHPAFRKQIFQITRLFWSCVRDHAARNKWDIVSHYSLVSQPVSQLVASKCYHSEAAALLPNYVQPTPGGPKTVWRANDRTSLLLLHHVLGENGKESKPIFAPPQHRAAIDYLFKGLALTRKFQQPARPVTTPPLNSIPCGDALRISCTGYLELCHVWVTPSLVTNDTVFLSRISDVSRNNTRKLFLYVALDDPRAAQISNLLEVTGYRFCGIVPLTDGHDYIVYGRYDTSHLQDLTLYSPQAKFLHRYMENLASMNSDRIH